jgi:protein-S-isoprenylcysteine O-methyltransferase Ste14
MLPLFLVWPYALLFWPVFVWVFVPERRLIRQARDLPRTQDAGSLKVITIGGQLGFIVAIVLVVVLPGAAIAAQRTAFLLGVLILVAAGLLRRHCFRMLGSRFTGAVVVTPDQTVIERGAYRWVRHPGYSAGFMIMIGFGLALGNWASVLVALLTSIIVYTYRVTFEERALVSVIGEPYRDYMRRTKRFIPFVV